MARSKKKTTRSKKPNYAFIDNENVNVSVQRQGRKIDWAKLKKWLEKNYNVKKAYMFMGYLPDYQSMYDFFEQLGYTLVFKPMNTNPNIPNKGNVDAELVLQAMIDYRAYNNAVIVSGDGDFGCLVKYLNGRNKLEQVIVPNEHRYSDLLEEAAPNKITSLTPLKKELSYESTKK